MRLAIILLMLSGCSAYPHKPAPDSVAIMPNDCANYQSLNTFLLEKIEGAPDEATQRRYKHRLWDYRYTCGHIAGK
jgi:hypothetical protein